MSTGISLVIESGSLEDFLESTDVVDFRDAGVAAKLAEFRQAGSNVEDQAAAAFRYVRDGIRHSFDSHEPLVTISSREVLKAATGICFAKSHLLAALLRGLGVPTGFCYQRVMRRGTPESGYALHGLNAVHFDRVGWVRVDARGDRPGVHSDFDLSEEHLAYALQPTLGERDYPCVYRQPLPSVLESLANSADTAELFYRRPERLEASAACPAAGRQ